MTPRLWNWARASAIAGGGQLLVQLLGFASGIMIIRLLAPEQYAYYTLANTTLGAMTVLTDGGVVSGVLAQGGRVWQNPDRLGAVVAAGLALRRRLAIFAVAVSVPIMIIVMAHQGAAWPEIAYLTLALIPMYVPTVTGQLLEAVPRLHQRLYSLQRIQVGINLGRLLLVAAVLPLRPLAAVASVAAGLPQIWGNWRLRKLAGDLVDWRVPAEREFSDRLTAQVRQMMPGAIFYSLSGQLTVWLISIFGVTSSIAAVGALGRIATILGVLTTVFAMVAVPRFARIPTDAPNLLVRRFWQSQLALAAICAVPVATLVAAPDPVLRLLGPNYLGFGHELVLMAISGAVVVMYASVYGLSAARGIVVPPHWAIPSSIAIQAALILLLPMNSVAGVIWLGLISYLAQWAIAVVWFSLAIRRGRGE